MSFGRISGQDYRPYRSRPDFARPDFGTGRKAQREQNAVRTNPRDAQSTRQTARPSTQNDQSVARATTRIEKDTASLKFSVKTADGDTVEISIDAQQLQQSERGYARGPEGRVRQRSESNSSSFTASVKVEGDLSEEELSDIQSLLAALGSGGQPQAGEGDLDTVSAYTYSFAQSHQVSRSTVQIYA